MEEVLSQIKSLRIEEVIEAMSEVRLKQVAGGAKAICPFHSEKSPSFSVSYSKNIYKCFGCGEGGDAISFVQKIKGVPFVDAVKEICDRFGIERQEAAVKSDVIDFSEFSSANKFRKAISLLKNRVSEEDCIKYSIGFAEQGVFIGRAVFAIKDEGGRIVGLAGRAEDGIKPKYVNSAESIHYSKSRILYGLDSAKYQIRRSGFAVIVEGYMDVISLHKIGVMEAVASCGTSFTAQQAELIKKYCGSVILAMNADDAGRKGMLRAIKIAEDKGLNVFVAIPNSDWDKDILDGIDVLKVIKNPISAKDFVASMYSSKIDAEIAKANVNSPNLFVKAGLVDEMSVLDSDSFLLLRKAIELAETEEDDDLAAKMFAAVAALIDTF